MQLKKNGRDSVYPHTSANSVDESDGTNDESYYGDVPAPSVRSRAGITEQETSRGAQAVRAESVIDVHSTFDGRYETEQDLRVEGTISGEIVCRGTLTIERDATANAKIEARDAAICGRVDGEIVCSGRLRLTATAIVTGTLRAGTLVIEEGASLKGDVETVQEQARVATNARAARSNGADSTGSEEAPREPASVAPLPSRAAAGRGREVPSFALVSSEERAAGERN
ncbi:MAG TPA: polymer-forming cytoskeletal protein [Tepidiformaceae bacterium]|nr:polymer-forming cytoskeletal protein [Tepidiformaceae bacterium]